VYYVLMS